MSAADLRQARDAYRRADLEALRARRRLPTIETKLRNIEESIDRIAREIEEKRTKTKTLERSRGKRKRRSRATSSQRYDSAIGAQHDSIRRLVRKLRSLESQRRALYDGIGLPADVSAKELERIKFEKRHDLMVLLMVETPESTWTELFALARAGGVPEEYLESGALMYFDRSFRHARSFEFFFGGEVYPDGVGHGHIVVKQSDEGAVWTVYARQVGELREEAA